MKRLTLLLVLSLTVLFGIQPADARASKNNVGTVIDDLKLRFGGKAPELKGKTYILEFWATWCGPCKTSIPHLNALYKKHKDKGLEVIGVTDEDKQTVHNFTKDVPIDYTIGYDTYKKLNEGFGITGIPHAMIVDKTGKIIWEGHPMSLPEAQLEAALKKE